jgi:protein-S-isoprenylcysteine O-methyltransferase Ste14
MSRAASRTLGNIVLVIAVVFLLCGIAGMLEMIPKLVRPSVMFSFVAVLVFLAAALRRRGRNPE